MFREGACQLAPFVGIVEDRLKGEDVQLLLNHLFQEFDAPFDF